MWPKPSDWVFRDFCGELTAASAEREETDELVEILKRRRNAPTEEFQFPIAIQV